MSYLTTPDATDFLRSQIVADEVEIEAFATVASSAIDAHCQRTFTVPTEATARLFVPSMYDVLKVHDIANTTGLVITVDGSAVTDYQLEIAPGTPGPIGVDGRTWPYAYIRLLSGSWGCGAEATVSITARWGWPATPAEVELACKMLVKDYANSRDTRFGFVQMGDFSRAIAMNGVVAGLLAPFRRVEAFGIA
jgi:hypothetical protein